MMGKSLGYSHSQRPLWLCLMKEPTQRMKTNYRHRKKKFKPHVQQKLDLRMYKELYILYIRRAKIKKKMATLRARKDSDELVSNTLLLGT